jgi:hypothetical protein
LSFSLKLDLTLAASGSGDALITATAMTTARATNYIKKQKSVGERFS